MTSHFLKLCFTPCKAEQPLRGIKGNFTTRQFLRGNYEAISLREKEEKDENHRGELFRKNQTKKVSTISRLKVI